MKFNIFGKKIIEVVRDGGSWQAYYLGNEGKKRKAEDVLIPSELSASDIEDYLSDLFHEMATLNNNDVKKL